MKWYWYLLFLIVSTVAVFLAGDWLDRPLWQIVEPRPVTFDQFDPVRKQWTTLVGDQERKNWWIETRAGRDPTVIRRLKLELPPLTSSYPYFGASISVLKMSCDAVICHEYVPVGNSNADVQVEMRYCVLDPASGKVIKRFTIPNNPIGSVAGHGSRLAFAVKGKVYLYDVSTRSERSVKLDYVNCLAFSPDGKSLACVSRTDNCFYLIDWEKALLIQPIKSELDVGSFAFINNDTLMLVHDRERNNWTRTHSRWRWDGAALKQISPGIKLESQQILPFVKLTPSGELHVSANELKDWPLQIKPLLQWLADKNVPIEKWLPKSGYRHWLVLDDQDHIQREYYVSRNERRELYDHFSVEVKPDKQYGSTHIIFWNDHPVWPNALAVGMVLYLLLYVTVHVWRRRRVH